MARGRIVPVHFGPVITPGRRSSGAAEPDPVFSFLNMADSDRGHGALSQSINPYGTSATGKIWVADDRDGASWPEHYAAASCSLTRHGTDPGAAAGGILNAGGIGAKTQAMNSSLYFDGAAGQVDPGSNDFVVVYMGVQNATSNIFFDTRAAAAAGQTGLSWWKHSDWKLWASMIDTTPTTVTYQIAGTGNHALITWVCDRSRTDGSKIYQSHRTYATSNPTTASGSLSGGNALTIGAGPGGGYATNGNQEILGFWNASGLLDMSDPSAAEAMHLTLLAGLTGRKFTVAQGSTLYPIMLDGAARNFVIEDATFTSVDQGMHPLESWADSVPYLRLLSSNSDACQIPGAEIPTGGTGAIRCWVNIDSAPAGTEPIASISDGTTADELLLAVDSDGYLNVTCTSSAGDNGSVIGSADICDGSDHKIEVKQVAGSGLAVKVDDVSIGTDASSTWPSSPDTFLLGKNANGDFGNVSFRAGESYGFHAWDEALW